MKRLERPIFSKALPGSSISLLTVKLGNNHPMPQVPIFISLRASKEMLENQCLELYSGVIRVSGTQRRLYILDEKFG